MTDEILAGLRATAPTLPCRLLYDARGSELFEQICTLPEYYPTRTECGILRDKMPDIADAIGAAAEVIEFGSGSGEKTALLLEGLRQPAGLHLVEISPTALAGSIERLQARFPQIAVHGQQGDYMQPLRWPPQSSDVAKRLLFFPGSTIGNFTSEEAAAFLTRLRQPCRPGDLLLLGTDMVKDVAVLLAAYNDQQGITAAFNQNILSHCNVLFDANFKPEQFTHEARYDDQQLEFATGDEICTEYSHKFTHTGVMQLAEQAGWQARQSWYDERRWFGVHLFEARPTASATF
jgi:dimethylhistidine N-methyltransferase